MKRNGLFQTIFIVLTSILVLSFTACNENIQDQTTKKQASLQADTTMIAAEIRKQPTVKPSIKSEPSLNIEKATVTKTVNSPTLPAPLKPEAIHSTAKVQASKQTNRPEAPIDYVTISVQGPSERGTVVSRMKVQNIHNRSVFDVLLEIAKEKSFPIDYKGGRQTVYVTGIADVYEFDYGPKSGWMFRINGKFSDVGAGNVIVTPGDNIEWLYTKDFGNDLSSTGGNVFE